jgi:hypothetical protein
MKVVKNVGVRYQKFSLFLSYAEKFKEYRA